MRARSAISTLDTANGAIILVFGLFLFSIQDIIIKHFSDHYSVLQIVFVRGLIALGLLLMMIKYTRENISLISRRPGLMVARGLLGFSSYTTYYLAVAAMPLAEVVSITFTMPLFVTAMSALILGEKVGVRRWSAVVVGFIGVLIILSPSGEFNSLAVWFAFVAAITYASQTNLTRFLGSHDHPMTIAFNAILVFTVASGILSLLLVSGTISISSKPSLAGLLRAGLGHADRYRFLSDAGDRCDRRGWLLLPVEGLLFIRGERDRAVRIYLYRLGRGIWIPVLERGTWSHDNFRYFRADIQQSLHLVPRAPERAHRNRPVAGAGGSLTATGAVLIPLVGADDKSRDLFLKHCGGSRLADAVANLQWQQVLLARMAIASMRRRFPVGQTLFPLGFGQAWITTGLSQARFQTPGYAGRSSRHACS